MSRKPPETKPMSPPRAIEDFNGLLAQLSICAEKYRACHNTTRSSMQCTEEQLRCVNGLTTPTNGMKG